MDAAVDASGEVGQSWVGNGFQITYLAGPKTIFELACDVSKLAYKSVDSDFIETRFKEIVLTDGEAFTSEQPHYRPDFLIAWQRRWPETCRAIAIPTLCGKA